MLRIAICDDNADFVQHTLDIIDCWPSKPLNTLCQAFDNGDELVCTHRNAPFDIILLDVIMPMLNGIETARELRLIDKNTKIAFLTSSPEYAVESYTVKADNYLLKPITSQRLYRCLDEFMEEISQNPLTITVKSLYTVQKLVLDNIVYVEAQNKHIIFAMLDGTTVETTEPLHICEEKLALSDCFFKCHRSYIVNINHIDTYSHKEIRMRSGYRIPISRNCQKAFEAAYFAVTFGKAGEAK